MPLRPRSVPQPTAPPAFVQVAYADAGSSTTSTQTATLSTPATAGNLLVVCGNSDATLSAPTGFTLADSAVNAQGAYIWYKIAAGGETAISTNPSVADAVALAVLEYSSPAGSPLDVTVTATAASGSATSFTAGTTPTTAQSVEIVVSVVGFHGYAAASVPTSPAWSNSFTARAGGGTTLATSGPNSGLFVADLITSSVGTYSTTATWTNAANDIGAITAAFKTA